eukprot:3999567-Amphidinium_carterae.2
MLLPPLSDDDVEVRQAAAEAFAAIATTAESLQPLLSHSDGAARKFAAKLLPKIAKAGGQEAAQARRFAAGPGPADSVLRPQLGSIYGAEKHCVPSLQLPGRVLSWGPRCSAGRRHPRSCREGFAAGLGAAEATAAGRKNGCASVDSDGYPLSVRLQRRVQGFAAGLGAAQARVAG